MRSFAKIAFLVAFVIVLLGPALVHTQDIVNRYSNGGADGGFKDALDGLNSLSEGPYPNSILSAVQATPPMIAGSAQGLGMLDKRGYYCNPGYGLCNGNFCCPTNELCFPPDGCCPRDLPYGCGQKYCCPYNACLSNGQCGCNDGLYRCGNKCCKYGCNSSGNCACPSNYPVDCGDQTCCPSGYYCIAGDKCSAIGGGDTPPPPPPPSPPSPPPPPPPVDPPRATSQVPVTPTPSTNPAPPPKVPPEIPGPEIPEPTIAPGGAGNSTASANRASKAVVVAVAVAVILVV